MIQPDIVRHCVRFTRKLVCVVVMEDGHYLRVCHHQPTRGHCGEHLRPEAVGHPARVAPEERVVNKPLVYCLTPKSCQVNIELFVNFLLNKYSEGITGSSEAGCQYH